MTATTARSAALALVLVVAAACSGPDVPLDAGVREYSTDIVYGRQSEPPQPAPILGANPDPAFPGFLAPPPPAPVASFPPPTVATPACAEADPFAFPAEVATPGIGEPPTAGRYTYRQEGTIEIAGRDPIVLPPELSRTVDAVETDAETGELTYDVVTTAFGETTTTSYAVRQTTGDPSLDGLFLTQVVTERPDGSVDQFAPLGGVRLIALPAAPQTTWNDVGTDPLTATSMIVDGTVVEKGRVNACGTVLDSWTVEVTGRILGPSKAIEIDATYAIGTQFGGLVLAEDVHLTGTDAGETVEQTSKTTINAIVPEPVDETSP